MANELVLNTGIKEYVIKDTFGNELCRIHVTGGDIGIIDRYRKLQNDYEDIIAPLKNIKIKNDGSVEGAEKTDELAEKDLEDVYKNIEIIKEAESRLINRINEVFGMRDAEKLFETRSAFSTVDGEFFAWIVLDMLNGIVANTIKEENEKSQERMKKYLKEQKK